MTDSQTQVLIVEDDDQLRQHLSGLVDNAADLNLIKSAGSVKTAQEIDFKKVGLALLDLGLPDGSGLDLITQIRATQPEARILIFTVFGDRDSVIKAFDAGADGFILKDSQQDEILSAIRDVMDGGAPISARAAAFLLRRYRRDSQNPASGKSPPKLSPRELEVLQYLARGFSYKEAARKMSLSPNTVSEYAASLYKKLAVNSRGEAVFEAMQNGLIQFR